MDVGVIEIGIAGWSGLLTAGLTVVGYFVRKRDNDIEQNKRDIRLGADTHAALELKVAEKYATKDTMMALFQEATRTHETAIARVEKRIDETNTAIEKWGDKVDKVADSIHSFQTSVMSELAKKT